MFEIDDDMMEGARIKVIGVGGAGGNAVNTMIQSGLEDVEFYVANTDSQALELSLAPNKIPLGANVTRGLGAGAKPDVGRAAASENQGRIAEALEGADMVFITAGMGGGTGTGAAPIVAKLARDQGALTVGVVSKPFPFEGRRRGRTAEEGLTELEEAVDTLIVIPNERLLAIADPDTTLLDAFRHADRVLYNGVQGVSELITVGGYINVDFADVQSVMKDRGMALMGTGIASGEDRARRAAEEAIASPLLQDANIDGATGILINITGGMDLKLHEASEAAQFVEETAHEDANIIFGTVLDETMEDEIKVTVIATGFERSAFGGGVARSSTPKSTARPKKTTAPAVADATVGAPRRNTLSATNQNSAAPRQNAADGAGWIDQQREAIRGRGGEEGGSASKDASSDYITFGE